MEVLDATGHLKIPVFIGILPPISYRNADFLNNEFPGIVIPAAFCEQLKRCDGDKKEERRVSLDYLTEMMLSVTKDVKGFYVIPQFYRFEMARELILRVRHG